MKYIITLVTIFCALHLGAQNGVNFESLTLQQALDKAGKENKMVFLDSYTTWCVPCKEMTEKEFPKKEAGDYFNPRFISVKFNIEQGEGKEIAQKYNITAVPTFLILNAQGEVIHTEVGSSPLITFMDKIKTALGEETSIQTMDKQYASGKMSKKELLHYSEALAGAKRYGEAEKVNEILLKKLSKKEKLSAEYWPLFNGKTSTHVSKNNIEYIIQNQNSFYKGVGQDEVDVVIAKWFNGRTSIFMDGIDPNRLSELDELNTIVQKTSFQGKEQLIKKIELAKARNQKNTTKVIEILTEAPKHFDEKDLSIVIQAANYLLEEGNKEQIAQIAALETPYTNAVQDEFRKPYTKYLFSPFKRQASVGIHWEEDETFEEILLKSQIERKPIFMDCYTAWCGPCKILDRDVFPREDVGDFFNKNFICIKRDMEKGQGPELLERFGIQAFPTLLIIDEHGNAVYKHVGGLDAEKLISSFESGLKNYQSFGEQQIKYNQGERSKEFLITYAQLLFDARSLDIKPVLDQLVPLLNDEEKVSPQFWYIYANDILSPVGSENYNYLIANRDRFRENVGNEYVDLTFSLPYYKDFMSLMYGEKEISKQEFQEIIKNLESFDLQDKTVIHYARFMEAAEHGTGEEILRICNKEFLEILPERVPLIKYGEFVKNKFNLKQKQEWLNLCHKIIAKIEDERYREMLTKDINEMMSN